MAITLPENSRFKLPNFFFSSRLTIITAPVLVAALDVRVEAKVVGAVEAAKVLHGGRRRRKLLTRGAPRLTSGIGLRGTGGGGGGTGLELIRRRGVEGELRWSLAQDWW